MVEDILAMLLGMIIGLGVAALGTRAYRRHKKMEQLKLDRKKIGTTTYTSILVDPPKVIVPEHTTKRWRKLPLPTPTIEWSKVEVELTEAPKAPVEPAPVTPPNPPSETVSASVEHPESPAFSQEALWGYDGGQGREGFFDD